MEYTGSAFVGMKVRAFSVCFVMTIQLQPNNFLVFPSGPHSWASFNLGRLSIISPITPRSVRYPFHALCICSSTNSVLFPFLVQSRLKPDGDDLLHFHRFQVSVLWCTCSYRFHAENISIYHRVSYSLWTEQQQPEVGAKTGFVFLNCRRCLCSFWLLFVFMIEIRCNDIQIMLNRLVLSGVSTNTYLVSNTVLEHPCTFWVIFHF